MPNSRFRGQIFLPIITTRHYVVEQSFGVNSRMARHCFHHELIDLGKSDTIRHLKTIVRDDATALYRARQTGQQRWRRDARGPDKHTGGDLRAIIQRYFFTVVTSDFGLEANLHAAPAEPVLRVATEAYPQLRADVVARVYHDDPEHILFQLRIELHPLTQE